MNPAPEVSVVVPAKNAEDYVADALTSLTRQFADPRQLEVVIVDDGSTDGTLEVVETYADRLPGLVTVRHEESQGLAAARNRGTEIASGRWIAYLDADDWLAPARLPALVEGCERLGCPWVRTDHTTVRGRHRARRRTPEGLRDVVLDPRDSILPAGAVTMVDYPYAWAGIFDASMREDGLLDFQDGLHTAEDRPWIWNLHLNGPRYAVVDAPSLCYRRGVATSLTQVYDRRQLDFARAFRSALDIVGADAEADRFVPKLARTIVAVTVHHYRNALRMDPDVYSEFLRVSRELALAVPRDVLEAQLDGVTEERQQFFDALLGPDWSGLPLPAPEDQELSRQEDSAA